ncbi:hypothetical protein Ddye_017283 [Dipteronia dyeriana]|uniref:Uncharacterized protein n=1 Tax=Dipteronia dyeriana TaxID=168575 RepID=A0AAD9U8W3_9ROSI|nr:hypothetical protein Ddye_017283 [Dipteronia dyeriana]
MSQVTQAMKPTDNVVVDSLELTEVAFAKKLKMHHRLEEKGSIVIKFSPEAFLSQLFLKKYVKNLSKKVSILISSNSKLKRELKEAKSTMTEAKRASKVAIDKLVGLEDEDYRLKAYFK